MVESLFTDLTDYIIGENCAGIYLLLQDNEVIYISKGSNVIINAYMFKVNNPRKKFKFNKVLVKFCQLWEAEQLERELTLKYLPKFNKIDKRLLNKALKQQAKISYDLMTDDELKKALNKA